MCHLRVKRRAPPGASIPHLLQISTYFEYLSESMENFPKLDLFPKHFSFDPPKFLMSFFLSVVDSKFLISPYFRRIHTFSTLFWKKTSFLAYFWGARWSSIRLTLPMRFASRLLPTVQRPWT